MYIYVYIFIYFTYILYDLTGADPGFCQGGWLTGLEAQKIFGAFLGRSGGMLPQKIFKIESARLP